ncbi:MAG: substrate-binding domain-containing protein [Victivallaceae bacterium]|nr:substrate-binding domain-containing protein [Victivallaceae bacterium]
MQVATKQRTEIQVIRELRRRIAFGYWNLGDQLPSEVTLAGELGVSRATLNKALKNLDNQGFFHARRGSGRVVTTPARQNRTGVISIILSDLYYYDKPSGSKLIHSIQEAVTEAGCHFNITALSPTGGIFHYTMRQQALNIIQPSNSDGIIVITQSVEAETALELSTYCPVVWFHHPTVKPGLTGVRYDWINGSFEAMKHLIENGHRKIALVNIMENFVSGREQFDGARLAMQQIPGGSEVDFKPIFVNIFESDAGYNGIMKLLENTDDLPTAIISGSDDYTPGIYRALTEKGLLIPDDISLISWNDTLTENEIPLPVDSVHIDFEYIGQQAAKNLLKMIAYPEKCVETLRVQTDLIKRGSVRKM